MSNGFRKPGAGAQKPVAEQHAAKKLADSAESGTLLKSGGSGGADAQVGVGIAGFFGALNIFAHKETPDEMQDTIPDPGTPAVETPIDPVEAVDLGNSPSTEDPKTALHQDETDTRAALGVTPLSLDQPAVAGNGSASSSGGDISRDINLEPVEASRDMKDVFSSAQAAPAEPQGVSQSVGMSTDPEENEDQTSEETNNTDKPKDGDALDPSEFSDLSGPVTVTYTGDAEGTITDGTNTINFSDIDNLTLTDFADVVDASADSLGVDIDAGAGSDTVTGSTGDDFFAGGDGDDSIDAGLGNDSVWGGAGNDTLLAGSGNDELSGEDGDDVLSGGDDDDTLLGGEGADTLEGGIGDDDLRGEDGDDSLDAGDGDDAVAGGSGNDTISGGDGYDTLSGGAGEDEIAGNFGYDSIDGGAGDDSLHGGLGSDTLDGGIGADTLDGGDWADTLDGGDGNDVLLGGDGGDRLEGGEGNDSLDGGVGTDTAIWSGDLSDFAISYDNGTDTFTVVDQNVADTDEGTDTVTNVDFFEFNGVTYTADQIEAYADGSAPTGISFVSGGAVDETVVDGGTIGSAYDPSGSTVGTLQSADASGIDDTHNYTLTNDPSGKFEVIGNEIRVRPGQTIDYETDTSFDVTVRTTDINGNTHEDALTINVTDYEGSYTVAGVAESVTGTSEEDSITGGTGKDTISGGVGNDTLVGGDGSDVLDGGIGDDTISGGAGNDSIGVGNGNDQAFGGDGDDQLSGGDGNDHMFGDAGNDTLHGGSGDDSLKGGSDDDQLSGDFGDDYLVADSGNDTVAGGDGDDFINGDAGNDQLSGDAGADFIAGGMGSDTISGGSGNDNLLGEDDADTFEVEDGFGSDTITGGEGGTDDDVIDLSALSGPVTVTYTGDEEGTIIDGTDTLSFSEVERLTLTDLADIVDATADSLGVNIDAGAGNDSLLGGQGADTITGGAGNDTLAGGIGNDTLSGWDGNDSLDGGAGDDTLYGEGGNDTLVGGAGDDFIDGADGVDVAVFSGDWMDYTITEDGGTYTVIDNRTASSDGTDTVTDVENFRFADGDVAIADVLNATPADITPSVTSVAENTAAGTVVATLSTTDVNANDTFSYAITSDLSGFFEIVGDEVRVASGASLDFETATSHDVTIEVTDASGATYAEIVTFTVTDTAEHLTLANGGVSFTDTSVTELSVTGGFGDDTINGSAGNDNINGGSGDDSISGGDGADYVHGWFHDDYLDGGGGNDTLLGDASNDTLVGGDGDDSLHGGNNNDEIEGGLGNDNINGGNDTDMAVYAGDLSDFTITWDGSSFTITDQDVVDGLDEGTDTVTNVENFTFNGATFTAAELQAYADGSAPTDISFASGGSINETVSDGGTIGSVNDLSGATVATLATTDASAGDTHSYTLVNDASGRFEIVGNEVRVKSTQVIDYETDTSFDLTVRTTDINGQSHDEILTLNVNDYAGNHTAGNGGETITGTSEEDAITGGTGNDSIAGGAGPDSITGGDGSDTISGGTGDDSLAGGTDEDTFIVEDDFGNDTIDGGADGVDDDVIDLTALTSPVTVTYATAESGTITNGADTITFSEIERFEFSDVGTYIDKRGLTDGTDFEGGSGNDTIYGTSGEDLLVGGEGDDVIYGYEDNDTIDGGEGSDLIYLSDRDFGGSNLITDSGTTGTDTVVFELDIGGARTFRIQSEFSSADGIEVIDGSTVTGEFLGTNQSHADFDFTGITLIDVDEIAGTDNSDTIIGSAGGDSIDGNNGDDYLSGAGGNDTIEGDSGDDTLLGGAGDDVLEGDDGNDVFYIAAMQGDDTIDGGSAGAWTDTIQLDGMGAGAVNVAGSTVDGDGWTLVLDGGHSVNSLNSGVLELSSDASGVVTFDDGGTISFADVERVTW